MTVGRDATRKIKQPGVMTAGYQLRRALLALVLLGAALTYTAPPAAAQGQYHICCTGGQGVFLRLGSPSFSAPKAPGPNDGNYNITVFCQTTGEPYNGVDIWDYISFNGNTGYINDSFLYTGYSSWDPRLPRCGATPPPPNPGSGGFKFPFRGTWKTSDGRNPACHDLYGNSCAPPYGFDFNPIGGVSREVLAVGDGYAKIRCAGALTVNIALSSGGQEFYYVHVDKNSAYAQGLSSTAKWVAQGAVLGAIYNSAFQDNCGYSTGAHLHFGVPSLPFTIDGVTLTASTPANTLLVSSQGIPATPVYTLAAAKAGSGSGVVASAPAGIDCGSTCSANYNSGTSVTLAATPTAGSTFTGWSGACTGVASCTVTMDAAKSVTATFALSAYTLAVSKVGAGSGTVSSAPAGISCGSSCSASFSHGTSVSLTATAAAGSMFGGWSGACSGTGSCTVLMGATKTVQALFVPTGSKFQVFGSPQRLLDTRGGQRGVLEAGGDEATAFTAGEVRRYLPGPVVGVPAGGSLMITAVAVAPSAGGFLVAWPCGSTADSAPAVSMLNYQSGVTISNNGIVRLDPTSGGLCVKSSAAANVILDSYGWFAASSTYSALPQPQRLFDTRPGQRGVLEALVDEATQFSATTVRRYQVAGATGVSAVAVNVAAVSPSASGEVRLYPCSATTSSASASPIVVFTSGSTISAGGTVTLSPDGGFCVRATAETHVIVDVTGWYTKANYRTFTAPGLPKLLLDTRAGTKGALEALDTTTPLAANTTYRLALAGKGGFPVAAMISSVRVTVTELTAVATGFISVWACGSTATPPPATALLNYRPMVPIAGSVIVPVAGTDAGICVRSSQPTHIALSATHWIAP